MMLGHDIFDPEIGKHVLVDHAFIVAGGEITKAARNWIGGELDASKRSQLTLHGPRRHIELVYRFKCAVASRGIARQSHLSKILFPSG